MGMLVLTRKVGEVIRIGDNITLMPVRIGPNSVRLGIEAPKDMEIVRTELDGEPETMQPRPENRRITKAEQ